MTAPRRRRGSLATRIALLGIAIAVVTGALAGVLATGLIRSADDRSARHTLSGLADAAQARLTDTPAGRVAQVRAQRLLQVLGVHFGVVTRRGLVRSDYADARDALTPPEIARLRTGEPVSDERTVGGRDVYVEARPFGARALVLVQARSAATAGGEQSLRRTLLAILVGVVVAAVVGAFVARALARPLRRTAAAAHALAAGHRDVTVVPQGPAEVADVATAVNTLSAALSHSEARQREFLLSVSHDLRTPLTAIIGYAESLSGGVVPPERHAEVGGVVLGEARRLEQLVGDLLDLARLDAADVRIDPVEVDLADVVHVAGAAWVERCRAAGVELRVEATPAPAVADPARVRQVLDGLLENALRVTPAGRPIVVATRVEATAACAEVRDGGPGLTDDDLSVAFERSALYRRYRGVRQVGTGLGLAIVHRLATRMGGTVEAGHAPEGGARFTLRLPPAGISAGARPPR